MSVYKGHGPKYWYELYQTAQLDANLSDGHNAHYWHEKYLAEVKHNQESLAHAKSVYEPQIMDLEKAVTKLKQESEYYNKEANKIRYSSYLLEKKISNYKFAIITVLVSFVFLMTMAVTGFGRNTYYSSSVKAKTSASSSYSAPTPSPKPFASLPPKTVSVQEEVWIVSTGKCYHRSSSCSNMSSPCKVTIDEAEDMGYKPCSKCY